MKVVYIAGPFRGASAWEIQQNVMAAMALALEVWRRGAVAICPHANTMFFQGAAEDDVWLKGDYELLKRSDAVLMTADWQRSSGAAVERQQALTAGCPVLYSLADLDAWLTQ